ncbi:MAG: alanine racemase, partial [Treponema sp.]|nr:alanine racemase [Treponema sp.]
MYDTPKVYNSYVLIDLKKIRENYKKVKANIDKSVGIIPVLKGNAYGLGLVKIAEFLHKDIGLNFFACSEVFEAEQIKSVTKNTDIFVMAGVPFNNIECCIENDFITPVYHEDYLRKLNEEAVRRGKEARVKIKLETGMNRIGIRRGDSLTGLLDLLDSMPLIKLIGAFTHFAEAESEDKSFTLMQLEEFKIGLKQLRERGCNLQYVHAFNSSSAVWLKDYEGITHIRNGSSLFGYDINIKPFNALNLEETLSWNCYVTHVKDVFPGETVGYNRTHKVEHPMQVATISIGYGDGYNRQLLFLGGDVIINGKRCKIIGVSMDQMLVDITGMEVKINDEATLIGRNGGELISVFEIQELMGLNFHSMTCVIPERVPRIYVDA